MLPALSMIFGMVFMPGPYSGFLNCGFLRDCNHNALWSKVSAHAPLAIPEAKDAVSRSIDREREGQHIDRALLKNVLGIFVEIGVGNMEAYETDFECPMLQDIAAYYSQKASSWIEKDSCPDCMLKDMLRMVLVLSSGML